MNWDTIKSAVLALFERISQTCLHGQDPVLKPIPIEKTPRQQPYFPHPR